MALPVAELRDLLVGSGVGVAVVRAGRGSLPHHVGCDPRSLDGGAIANAVARGVGAVRIEAVTEGPRARVGEEAVLAAPTAAVVRVERVDVDVAAERVERCAARCR